MSYRSASKPNLLKYYPFFVFPLILLYLLINIFDGNNGLLSHNRLDAQILSLKHQIDDVKKSNELYQIKISSMSNLNSKDLIDEQIRSVLGYGKNSEYVIYLD